MKELQVNFQRLSKDIEESDDLNWNIHTVIHDIAQPIHGHGLLNSDNKTSNTFDNHQGTNDFQVLDKHSVFSSPTACDDIHSNRLPKERNSLGNNNSVKKQPVNLANNTSLWSVQDSDACYAG